MTARSGGVNNGTAGRKSRHYGRPGADGRNGAKRPARSRFAPARLSGAKRERLEELPAGLLFGRNLRRLTDTAADRRAVRHDTTATAGLHHARHAIATRLDHVGVVAVAAGARDGNAVLSHFAAAHSHRAEVDIAHGHAVLHHAAAIHPAGEHRAQVLHHAGSHLVVAGTG